MDWTSYNSIWNDMTIRNCHKIGNILSFAPHNLFQMEL